MSRQSKSLWWARLFPMCAQTTWSMNMTAPTSCCGESHRFGVVCICAARHSKTLNSQLEAELGTFVQGIPRLMPLSSLLWVFLAFTFSGREASKHGCTCSGWKACTQARGASWGLGEETGVGEKQASYDFSLFWGVVVLKESNSYIILFTVSSLFPDFSHRVQCSPESNSRPARHIHSSWGVSHHELSVWDKLEQL